MLLDLHRIDLELADVARETQALPAAVAAAESALAAAESERAALLAEARAAQVEADRSGVEIKSLEEKIHRVEHRFYPEAIKKVLSGGFTLKGRRVLPVSRKS
ncbi:MAG TPA: hypothetical protein PK280_13300 [Planctomycetota bacterium]|nr:hypothetical protein [Planctomycetota bacterium]